jgi:magnesium-transporting ATPase (P-type)
LLHLTVMHYKSDNAWSLSPEQLTEILTTNQTNGLSSTEADARLKLFGENIFESSKKRSPLTIFLKQFANPLIILLCIAVVITGVMAEWIDMAIIAFAVIVNTMIGFFQESKAEKAITDLKSYVTHRTRVIRDGHEKEIDPRLLVPGDLLHITNGARITADARIIREIEFTTDEALLTGESLSVEKTVDPLPITTPLADRNNMVFAGTLNIDGSAYALVTSTGYQTEIGKLAKLVDETESDGTPLQKALEKITWVIIFVTIIVVIAIFITGVVRGQDWAEMFVISIAVLVSTVPEALPISLTAVLAIGVERIAKRKGIMRSLTAAETLGSTTLIITDKTGTLTQANMQLADVDTIEHLSASDFTPEDHRDQFDTKQKELLRLARCASEVIIENPEDDPHAWVIQGADLETNIARAAAQHGITQTETERTDIQIRIPFSSKHKFSVTRIPSHYLPAHLDQFEDPHVVMGAPDILLTRSNLTPEKYEQINSAIHAHSDYGRRVLGIALFTPRTDPITVDDIRDITFLGVLSFNDPIRPEVPEAIRRIMDFDTKVIMATGDLPGTAIAIGRDLGWDVSRENVLTGQEMAQLNDEELTNILDRIRIFARVTPEDKLRITQLHQKRGEVVAMTGDGVNDSPSLKAANIGIAVGSGSDVAKSVADLVLLDDNFKTIVATIEEGKQILSNIKKVFIYLMANASDALVMIGGAIIIGVSLPLTAVQIIWVNLFTSSLPAIAFAFDRQLMRETKKTSRNYFDVRMLFLTIFIGITTSLMLLALYLFLLDFLDDKSLANSIVFASFGTYILFIAFSFIDPSRPIFSYSPFKNIVLLVGIGIGLTIMVLTYTVPFLRDLIGVQPLPLVWIAFIVLWTIMNMLFVESVKWFTNTVLVRKVDESPKIA